MTDINKIADEAKKVFDKIDKKFNTEMDEVATFLHITEEVGETAKHILSKYLEEQKGSTAGRFNRKELKEELTDVILYSLLLAKKLNIDISKELETKIKKNKARFKIN